MPTNSRPRLLDLFCGAGGCSMGYHRAGFDVVGAEPGDELDDIFPGSGAVMDAWIAWSRQLKLDTRVGAA